MHWIALPWPTDDAGQPASAESAWWALHLTPRVVRCDEALLLEVATTERLWGGREALQALVLRHAQAAGSAGGAAMPWATGATAWVALALLRLRLAGHAPPPVVPQGLALGLLNALRPHQAALQALGCRTWGDVRAMPRAGVARRWGAAVLLALDQAYGDAPQPQAWLALPEQFECAAELPQTAQSADALLWSASRMLTALHHWLLARQQGVLALELAWRHALRRVDGVDVPPGHSLQLRVARPSQDLAHVRRLLAEHLARTTLAAPVQHITLRALDVAPLPHASASLLPPDAMAGMVPGAGQGAVQGPVLDLLERLAARLGPGHVQAPLLHDDHRPEAQQGWQPATTAWQAPPAGMPALAREALWWPTWLVRPARRLQVQGSCPCWQGPLRLLAGPHRLEAGWWSPWLDAEGVDASAAVRDYFMAHNDRAGLVWVYRLRASALAQGAPEEQWFLQGIYG